MLLAAFLIFAGIAHLTFGREDFRAQVPVWLPLDVDFVVLASGVVEILLGLALASTSKWMPQIGLIVAAFFVAVFAGNINQYVEGIDAFGLNTDDARLIRLFFQPVLIAWALWSSNALKTFAKRSH
ncbi:unannotated protein [freshwater metagenome]|uniref:Unannotated protein n=1 Tax=freshwater metagenome TaxID=449393 RepID=A0A6J6B7T6_9ZZZZ